MAYSLRTFYVHSRVLLSTSSFVACQIYNAIRNMWSLQDYEMFRDLDIFVSNDCLFVLSIGVLDYTSL